MGEPACLPNFSELAKSIAQGTGEVLAPGEPEDQFLGRLQHKGQKVHERAAQVLTLYDPQPTDLHRNLLRLFSNPSSLRVVTTNFDLLFEKAAEEMLDGEPAVYTAPALPIGSNFIGIVHIHGSLDRESDLVLTDQDFGRAYLTEGWARRFLVGLFRSYTVLFVGYSLNDTVMRYLARALPPGGAPQRYALTDAIDPRKWDILGVEPIVYPKSYESDHSVLYNGINSLAEYAQRGTLDWRREISEIAKAPPPLDTERADLINDALSDLIRARFFTEAATRPEWIEWLERNTHFDNLFKVHPEALSERDKLLADWLANRFAHEHADDLYHLIARHNLQIHRDLWFALARNIGFLQGQLLGPADLSRWVSLLLATAPPAPWIGPIDFMLPSLGERCADAGLTDSLLDIFAKMISFQLEIASLLPFLDNPNAESKSAIQASTEPVCSHYSLSEFWRLRLKPRLEEVAERLLATAVQNLLCQHRTLSSWQSANKDWDAISYGRSAIEPHEQDESPAAIHAVIDVARDCLEYLASTQPVIASSWCDRLMRENAPILRRLSVHALPLRDDLTADEKLDWFLTKIGINDFATHHEAFQAIRRIYPDASATKRQVLIAAILAQETPGLDGGDKKSRTAYQHFKWLHWLHQSDPKCEITNKHLEDIQAKYPEFQPSEYPDLHGYIKFSGFVIPQSPWTTKELLARPGSEWVDDLVSFQEQGPLGPDQSGLLRAVEEASSESFEWGIALADALAASGHWDVDLWPALIRAWSRELDEHRHREVLARLKKIELYSAHTRSIAESLCALVKEGGPTYATKVLAEANEIAVALWGHLEESEPPLEGYDWLFRATNHPAGIITEFWIQSLALWRRSQDPSPDSLGDEYCSAFSTLTQNTTTLGRLTKAVMASRLGFLCAADEKWTKENLIPLFECADPEDLRAVWEGLLYGGLNHQLAAILQEAFLKAVSCMETLFPTEGDMRRQFVRFYSSMVTYFVDDPLSVWIPKFFQFASTNDEREFAWAIGSNLRTVGDVSQQEWWGRWLEQYWKNRLQNIPATLGASEVEAMLEWLPYLETLFPKAVALFIQMPQTPVERSSLLHSLKESGKWSAYPEATGKLFLHLAECETPQWFWYEGKELIEKIMPLDITVGLKVKLEELLAKVGPSLV